MAQLFNNKIFSVVGTNSAVGVGWKLKFYTTGTSTARNVYPTEADAIAGTNSLGSTVAAEASGRWPVIWGDGTQYKVVLTDALDVVKETIPVFNEVDLASASGSDRVGLADGGTLADLLADLSVVSLTQKGGGAAESGATNSTALLAAWNAVKDTGGIVDLGPGTIHIDDTVLPQATKMIWLRGAGYGATWLCPTAAQGGSSAATGWTLTIGDSDTTASFIGLKGFGIRPPNAANTRARFNGLRICPTNQLVAHDVHGEFCIGQAFRIERAHNSVFHRLRTFSSGDSTNNVDSCLISGTLGDWGGQPDSPVSDISFPDGTSEADYQGWKIENTSSLRSTSTLKIHGSANTTRGLHLHRVRGAVELHITHSFGAGIADGRMVRISDAGSSSAQTIAVTTAGTTNTLLATVYNTPNNDYIGTGTGALIEIDHQTANSVVVLNGLLLGMTASGGGDYRYVRTVSPGTTTYLDMTGLKFSDVTNYAKFLDDQRTSKRGSLPNMGGARVRPETAFVSSVTANRAEGDLLGPTYAGTSTYPPHIALGFQTSLATTRAAVLGYEAVEAEWNTTLSATQQIMWPTYLNLGGDATGQMVAYLESVSLGGDAFTAAYAAGNRWQCSIYKSGPTGVITLSGLPSDAETITIGAVTLTFKTTASLATDVQIGADAAATITNLSAKITSNIATVVVTASTSSTITLSEIGTTGALTFTEAATNVAITGSGTLFRSASVRDLNISLDTLSGSLGDGHPSLRVTDGTYGDGLKYWSGQGLGAVGAVSFNYNEALSLVMTRTGAPANLDRIKARLLFTLRQ